MALELSIVAPVRAHAARERLMVAAVQDGLIHSPSERRQSLSRVGVHDMTAMRRPAKRVVATLLLTGDSDADEGSMSPGRAILRAAWRCQFK